MRALVLLLLAGCATSKVALTPREAEEPVAISPEETAAWEAAWEEKEAARAADMPRAAMAPPPAPPRPAAAAPAPAPRPVPADATVAAVVLHTPAGDMEVRCPNVCPPGQACVAPAGPEAKDPGPGIQAVGFDLLKEVLMPLAAAIGGMLAGIFINKKGRKKT